MPPTWYVVQDAVEVLRGVVVVVVDEQLADLFLEAHASDGGFHPRNRVVVEVERRGLEVDVELARPGARGTGGMPAAVGGDPAAAPATGDAGNAGQRVGHHLAHRGGDVHHDAGFVGVERFQRGQLGFQQRGRHEVAGTTFSPCPQHLFAAVQVQEHGVRRLRPDGVAVAAAQGRAGQHQAAVAGVGEFGAHRGEPGPAVLVRQGSAGRHLGDVFHRVEGIAVEEGHAQFAGHEVTDGGLAAAGDAHHDDAGLAVSRCGAGVSQSVTSRGRCRRPGGCRAGRPAGTGTRPRPPR